MKVELKSKTDCPYCHLAKTYLRQHNIEFIEHVFDADDERQAMYDALHLQGRQRTVPQVILVENDHRRIRIGGYNELLNSDLVARFCMENFNAEF